MLQSLSRFSKEDMVHLSVALGIPKYCICPQGTKATGMEALMLMLRSFAYPSRLCDLVPLFGRTEQELSQLFNTVCADNLCMVSIPSPLHGMQPHLSLDRKRHTYSFLPPIPVFRLGMDGSHSLFSSYPCQRFSLDPMLWVHWWYCETHFTSNCQPTNYVQWAQKSTLPQVSGMFQKPCHMMTTLMYIYIFRYAVCLNSKWLDCAHVRAIGGLPSWRFHAVCKWIAKQTALIQWTLWRSIRAVWRPCLWCFKKQPFTFSLTEFDTSTARV